MNFFKPKDPLQKKKWEQLHKKGYHPSIEESINRITEQKNQNIYLFDEWSKILDINIDVKEKTVLEIGFGGGWYLAQMLFRNASKVIGFEISENIISKATEIFEALNLKNYTFYQVNQDYLKVISKNTVDIIFQITVFQHISEQATKNYLLSSYDILKNDGMILCQFLMNETDPKKNSYAKNKEGIVYYSHDEILKLVDECNLRVEKFGDHEWRDGHNSYWRMYLIQKCLN